MSEDFDGSVIDIDAIEPTQVGPGCSIRELRSAEGLSVWMAELEPGAEWPYRDHHADVEGYLVVAGTVVEAGKAYDAGTYIEFPPGSSHRPAAPAGARLFGFNCALRGKSGDSEQG
jgi:anti-sigma factor ChrR (cupin superfamily)